MFLRVCGSCAERGLEALSGWSSLSEITVLRAVTPTAAGSAGAVDLASQVVDRLWGPLRRIGRWRVTVEFRIGGPLDRPN